MSCPTCDHKMQMISKKETAPDPDFIITYWCPRCGTRRHEEHSEDGPPQCFDYVPSYIKPGNDRDFDIWEASRARDISFNDWAAATNIKGSTSNE